jgi:hypothetical protein
MHLECGSTTLLALPTEQKPLQLCVCIAPLSYRRRPDACSFSYVDQNNHF